MLVRTHANDAVEQRHRGRLDEARRTALRLLAFGTLIVSRHPDRPAAHLALCEAYRQIAKNAWQTSDRATIEWALSRALREARQALSINNQ